VINGPSQDEGEQYWSQVWNYSNEMEGKKLLGNNIHSMAYSFITEQKRLFSQKFK